MTAARFRATASQRHCVVCGAEYRPLGPQQRLCRQTEGGKLTACARTAQRIRWYRAALAPDIAAKYGMTPETVRSRLEDLLAKVHDRASFEAPVTERRPRRRSLAMEPVIGMTEQNEAIVATEDGGETIAQRCGVCDQLFAGPPGACGQSECAREWRRRRAAQWYIDHKRGVMSGAERRRADPEAWAAPPPSWDGPLPGAVLPIDLTPLAARTEKLGPALHAVLTRLLRGGRGHDPARPEWSLLFVGEQTSSGWAVWLPQEVDVEALRGRTFEADLRQAGSRLTFGRSATLRLKPPTVTQTGRHRVRLTTITPVCMRALGADGHRYRSFPQTPTLWTALTVVAQRIGLSLPDPTAIGIVRVSHATTPERVVLNQGRGVAATAWSGDVVLDVNSLGRWLLEVAARIGLGGRTAFGLGRIAVRDEHAPVESAPPAPAPWEVVVDAGAKKFADWMGVSLDEARAGVLALVETATFEGASPGGLERWRAGDVLLVAQPTTMRTLRVVDVVLDGAPLAPGPRLIEELWRTHAA